MGSNFKITARDMAVAEKLCEAIEECPVDTENCIFIMPTRNGPCSNCPIMDFKTELLTVAEPFIAGWQGILEANAPTTEDKIRAVWHLFIGLGALYSANGKRIPRISEAFIEEIHTMIHQKRIGYLDEAISDLKSLSGEWYERLWSSWRWLNFPNDVIWIDNVLMLKTFLEAMKLDQREAEERQRPNPKKSKEPIKPWASEQDKKDFSDSIENWRRQEAKKKKGA
jgi:hypothetical protein